MLRVALMTIRSLLISLVRMVHSYSHVATWSRSMITVMGLDLAVEGDHTDEKSWQAFAAPLAGGTSLAHGLPSLLRIPA